jgi:general secretion pathway protein G
MRKTAIGFTLIELLVVISIIGILATLVAANLNSARLRARDAERKSDLKNIQTALRLYYNDKGSYPAASVLVWGNSFVSVSGTTTYMQTLPKDPLSTQIYKYVLNTTDSDSYTLSACLENTSDTSGKSISISGWTCSTGWVFQVSQ